MSFGIPPIQQSLPESRIPEISPSTRSLYFAVIPAKSVPKRVVVQGGLYPGVLCEESKREGVRPRGCGECEVRP
jgi:hypothetical protein